MGQLLTSPVNKTRRRSSRTRDEYNLREYSKLSQTTRNLRTAHIFNNEDGSNERNTYMKAKSSDQFSYMQVVIRVSSPDNLIETSRFMFVKDKTITIKSSRNPSDYHYDKVYGEDDTLSHIFVITCIPLINDAMRGYDTSFVFYGHPIIQKNTVYGKLLYGSDRGILPRVFEKIFFEVDKDVRGHNSSYLLLLSFVEVLDEQVYDLLSKKRKQLVDIKLDSKNGYIVPRVSRHVITSINQATRMMLKAQTRLTNEVGQSHTILSIHIEKTTVNRITHQNEFMRGKMDLVCIGERQYNPSVISDHPDINRSLDEVIRLIKKTFTTST